MNYSSDNTAGHRGPPLWQNTDAFLWICKAGEGSADQRGEQLERERKRRRQGGFLRPTCCGDRQIFLSSKLLSKHSKWQFLERL